MSLDEARMARMESRLDELRTEVGKIREAEAANAVRRQHVDDQLGNLADGLAALKQDLERRDAAFLARLDELAKPRRWTIPELGAAGAALTGALYALGNTLSILLGHGPVVPPPPPPAPVEQTTPKEGP